MILACINSFAIEFQEHQRVRARWLAAEAAELRTRAEELRKTSSWKLRKPADSEALSFEEPCGVTIAVGQEAGS
jgi:hypothetical protein